MQEILENTSAQGGNGLIAAPCADVVPTLIPWLDDCRSGWQWGEQGVIDGILESLGEGRKFFVEFGAGDGKNLPLTCDRLIKSGWTGLLIEKDEETAKALASNYHNETNSRQVSVCNQEITVDGEHSLGNTLKNFGNAAPDVLVIDVDSIDYYIWRASAGSVRARIVCIEHYDTVATVRNDKVSNPVLDDEVPAIERCGDVEDGFRIQAGREAIRLLGESMGYSLVWRNRINSIFVVNEEYPKLVVVPVKINVGAGDTVIPGFTPLDIKTGTDIRKLPYEDGSVDVVYASHVLEHLPFGEIYPAMKEMARVLRPHGEMWVAVPDMSKTTKEWNEINRTFMARVIMGGQTDENDYHKSCFDQDMLRRAMNAVGIGMVTTFDPITNDSTCTPHSLNLKGRKRHFGPLVNPNITLILSQPRLGFTDNSNRLIALAHRMKFNVQPAMGAFWDRDMEAATWTTLNRDNPDLILYADYDGMFDPEDVERLIAAMNADPQLACAVSLQMSRHDDMPLVYDPTKDYSTPLTTVNFGHFGLTAVRPEVFREMATPWFWTTPGVRTDGTVGFVNANGCDADITFWRIMREYGFKVVQVNDNVVGHLVLCVKWPKDSGFGVTLQPIESYYTHGKPKTAKMNQDIYRKRADELKAAREKAVQK